jgi:chemotaxis protein histidine kinase CheA
VSTPGGFEGIDLDQLWRMFMAEAREMNAALETGALSLERSPGDAEVINDVFRSAHTLKGAAATIGLSQIAELTHEGLVRDGESLVTIIDVERLLGPELGSVAA